MTYGVLPADIRGAAYGVTIPTGATVDLQLSRLIDKAELQLPTTCIDARVAAGQLVQATVASVIEDMVIRVVKNAKGLRQFSIDDFTATIDTALSSGALYLADGERNLLCPAKAGSRVGSVSIGIPAWRMPGGCR